MARDDDDDFEDDDERGGRGRGRRQQRGQGNIDARRQTRVNQALDVGADLLGEMIEVRAETLKKIFGNNIEEYIHLLPSAVRTTIQHPYVLGGLDLIVRRQIQGRAGMSQGARNALVSVSDAFFDRLRTLPADPSEKQAKEAVHAGIQKARTKLDELTAGGGAAAKLSWPLLCVKLPAEQVANLTQWDLAMQAHLPAERERWVHLRDELAALGFDNAKVIVERLVGTDDPNPNAKGGKTLESFTAARLGYLESVLGHKPTLVEQAIAVARGTETQQLKIVREGLAKAQAELNTTIIEARARRRALNRRHR